MKKIIISLLFMFLMIMPLSNINAVSSEKINYEINKYYINSEIEIAGGLRVRQIIEVEGTYNGYSEIFNTKNTNEVEFTGLESDLKGSSIYNPTSVEKLKVGLIKNAEDLKLEDLNEETLKDKVEFFEEKELPQNGESKVYSVDKTDNGKITLKMYNEIQKSKTVFYLEYVVTNILVEHNDSAEFYYNFLSADYPKSIKDTKIFVALPYPAEELFKVWAHGQRDARVEMDSEKRGVIAYVNNYQVGAMMDIRILFDKELFQININESKKSGLDAVPIIEKIETDRANEANKYRMIDGMFFYGMYGLEIIYLCSLIGAGIFVYLKHDKEYKSNFKGEYYREFIDEYPVETLSYLMDGYITSEAFSSSILNLIYKKNIDVETVPGKKKPDYKMILKNRKSLSEAETKIIELLFNEIGNGKTVLLSDIKSKASKTSSSGENVIYNQYTKWQGIAKKDAIKQNFYVDNHKTKLLFIAFGIIGILIFALDNWLNITVLRYATLPLSIIFIIYILSFKKRSIKGNEHYKKWSAFKKFLKDFGRFDEKELPEIKLWERYLVYATVLKEADNLRKTMKIKFEEMNPDYDVKASSMFDFYMYNNISSGISRGITDSINTSYNSVQSYRANNMSSGSGGGGGFSSGAGHGGGGGNSGGAF